MAAELSTKQRKFLSGLAHGLSPVVQLGAAGVTDGVVEAIATALDRHELIKVKLPKCETAAEREAIADEVIERTGAMRVKVVGRVLIAFQRRNRDLPGKPRIEL